MTTQEFDCLDCGVHVVRFGQVAANDQDYCAECEWCRSRGLSSFVCPSCRKRSYNLNDVRERFCSACKQFFDASGAPTF